MKKNLLINNYILISLFSTTISQKLSFIYKYPLLDLKQVKMANYISDPNISIIIAHGVAGTGKTLVATQESIKLLKLKNISKIILTRPLKPVEDEEIGHLPGTLENKMTPWILPILDYFKKYYTISDINKLKDQNQLEIVPFAFMRGRTFDNSIIIADEMQNSSITQMKLLLTRIGKNSKIIILGDINQTDLEKNNGLDDILNKLKKVYNNSVDINKDGFGLIEFDEKDIKRNEIITKILELYK